MKNQISKILTLCIFLLFAINNINAQNTFVQKANPNHYSFMVKTFKSDVEFYMQKVFKQTLFQVGLSEELIQCSIGIYAKRGEAKAPIILYGNKLNAKVIVYLQNIRSGDKIIIDQIKSKGENVVHDLYPIVIDFYD